MTTCLSSRILLKEIIEFEYSEAKDNPEYFTTGHLQSAETI